MPPGSRTCLGIEGKRESVQEAQALYFASMSFTLIYTIVASIVVAFVFGVLARKLKMPSLLGYLVAGILIGPNTPGFVADVSLAKQLAEIGIILLMFGVGLHFSLSDLVKSWKIALPGALAQMTVATVIGAALARYLGFSLIGAVVFGFSLSVASTIVLLRSLEQRGLTSSLGGRIAVSWLILEDIAMVLALVMLPVVADMVQSGNAISVTTLGTVFISVVFKIGGFVAFMILIGRRFLPWLVVYVARLRSEELNSLCILAIALGFATLAFLVFDASLALGAFLAGVMLGESEIGRKSAENSRELRNAFSVLFFVSVGMLFNPHTLIDQPLAVIATYSIIVFAKCAAAIAILLLFRQKAATTFVVAIGLAQIGEFSFILGSLGLSKNLISAEGYNLILAGAMLSIMSNPLLFRLYDRIFPRATSA